MHKLEFGGNVRGERARKREKARKTERQKDIQKTKIERMKEKKKD